MNCKRNDEANTGRVLGGRDTMKDSGVRAMKEANVYKLQNFQGGEPQQISFYEMLEGGRYVNGTTLESLLSVAHERLFDLNDRFPCRQNALALTKIDEALMWLENRTKDRISRGVEGRHEL